MNTYESRLIRQLQDMDASFQLDETQLQQLNIFYENLVEWNKVMNLTGITEEPEVYEKHFLDSISIIKALSCEQMDKIQTLIDVGTGAGFPGLPLAIAFPNIQVTLMDSLNKRISFLEDTVAKCKLKNVICIHSRAEELSRTKEHRSHYDLAVSRAVANTSTLSEYCLPFVRDGGLFVAFKADKVEEELPAGEKAIKILGGEIADKVSFVLPETDYSRVLLLVKKLHATPNKYPRKAGTPSKEPLGM